MNGINKNLYAAAEEIASAMSKSPRAIRRMADKDNGDWAYAPEKIRGTEKKWFLIANLPKDIREKVSLSHINATLKLDGATKALAVEKLAENAVAKPVATQVDLQKLDDRQRLRDGSRRLILQFVATAKSNGMGMEKAVKALNAGYADGSLSPNLQHAIAHCNDKMNDARSGKLSCRSVQRWQEAANNNGHCIPKKTRVETPWDAVYWVALFLACYRKPQKPNMREAHAAFEQAWAEQGFTQKCPSYDAVYQLRKRIPKVILEMGRSTGSELAALKPFIRRDWSGMSNEVWVGDGHSFKAKVRHPEHGYAFAPEVTVIIDAASRYIVGWAFSLSENQIAVSEALGQGMLKHGKPLIYYSDNGSGQTAKTIDHPAGGMLARLGVHHETGIPGNPQGRGIIEGLWDITAIAVAKTLPTFQGTGMDGETLRKNTQAINSAKNKGLVPEFVTQWQVFIDKCEAQFDWYNTQHKHSALGGKTPSEVYHTNFDERWGIALTDDEKINLYRPFVERIPARGEVRWINNIYFHQALAELPDKTKVRVAYDLHDANQVWISDLQGRFICEAVWDGNKRDAFPVSLKDKLKDERIDGMVKRAQDKIDMAHAERGNLIDGEVLARVPVIPSEPVEPLKRVMIYAEFNSEKEPPPMSYQDTVRMLKQAGQ